MSEPAEQVEQNESDEHSTASRRRRPPAWGIALFVAVMAGMLVINQLASTSGRPVAWIENDLDRALSLAADRDQRVFLYLYEQDDPTHERNELQVFTQRWARQPLEDAVSCRVEMSSRDNDRYRLRHRYGYDGKPLFLLLNAEGEVMGQTAGAVDERQFFTYIAGPIADHVRQADGDQEPEQ